MNAQMTSRNTKMHRSGGQDRGHEARDIFLHHLGIFGIIGNAEARIDAKLAAGDIDAERAQEKLDSIEERITARVNGEGGERGPGRGGPRGV